MSISANCLFSGSLLASEVHAAAVNGDKSTLQKLIAGKCFLCRCIFITSELKLFGFDVLL